MSGDQLTLLPAASLASLSVWPGSREARQMTAISGQRCLAFLRSCDPVSSALRTLVGSSIWHSTTCLLTWHHKVTKQGRSYYQLRASVPPTSERGSGSWPTPRARDAHAEGVEAGIRHKEKWGSQTLATAARVRPEGMWPTPWASEVEMRTYSRTPSQDAGKHGLYLQAEVLHAEAERMWMTPKARDADFGTPSTSGRPRERSTHLGTQVAFREGLLPTPTADSATERRERYAQGGTPLTMAVGMPGLKLNPEWVSRLMGFPDDYLTLDGEATP